MNGLKLILTLSFSLLIFCAYAQRKRDIYRIHKGYIYFRHKNLGHSYHRKYIIHKNPEYITFAGEEYDILEWAMIFHSGHLLMRPFANIKYDPFFENFQVIGEYHAIDRSQVFYRTIKDEGHPHGPSDYYIRFVPIEVADSQSFTYFEQDQRFGRDDRHVYYKYRVIEGADPTSFEVLSTAANADYSKIKLHSGHKIKVATGTGLGRDKDHLYWGYQPVDGFDPEKVKIINNTHFEYDGKVYEIISYKNVKLIKP